MFWRKKKNDTGPTSVSAWMARLIGDEWGKIPRTGDHWAEYLAVMRPRSGGGDDQDVRIFDKWSVAEKKLQVTGYSSLDPCPDLILFEGWFNQKMKRGEIKARKI